VLPNFLIAGVAKSGTSSLHLYLREHPDVFLPQQKELHYFTRDVLRALTDGPGDGRAVEAIPHDLAEYSEHFRDVAGESAVGETSPSYFSLPFCIDEIKATLVPELKVIVLLRNPFQRAYSNYLHLKRDGKETLPFYDALKAEAERRESGWSPFWWYKANSLYSDKLSAFVEAFGQDAVKVVLLDELSRHRLATLKTIFEFLGVDPHFVPANVGNVFNRGGTYRFRPAGVALTWRGRTIRKYVPRALVEPAKRVRRTLLAWNTKSAPPMDSQSLNYLRPDLVADLARLQEEFGLEVGAWIRSAVASA
jgi:hypothetical protein